MVDGVSPEEAHATSGQGFLDETVLGLLLNEKVQLRIVHQMGQQWEMAMGDHILDELSLKDCNLINAPLALALLFLYK